MPAPRFHDLPVAGVRALTDDAVAVRLAVPEPLREAFRHLPGQYVTLRATIDGSDVRRSYSISSAAGATGDAAPDGFEVGVRRVPGGAFSTRAATLAFGDTLAVMPPEGRFVARPGEVRNAVLVAAGSGITPCLSIASSLLARDPDARVTLLYGNRDVASIMFRSELDALKNRFLERFVLIHATSREPQDVAFLNGRVSADMLDALASRGLVDVDAADGIWLCGPAPMIEGVTGWLAARGVAPERVHRELFAATGAATAPRRPDAATGATGATSPATSDDDPEAGASVEIVLDGTRRRIRVDGARETVLAAATRQGLELPFSCAGGMCCTCRCRVVTGAATMDANYSLEAWETDAGFTLACQARPVGDALTLDFDAT